MRYAVRLGASVLFILGACAPNYTPLPAVVVPAATAPRLTRSSTGPTPGEAKKNACFQLELALGRYTSGDGQYALAVENLHKDEDTNQWVATCVANPLGMNHVIDPDR